ncbi:hypothetical protein ACHAXA_004515 [Cyclostephanos tholiformis]|uniref:Uncharacterized protein n=1 Tax=Cyclostephanos tholiformis TaxID=382380 RepID=A0ABD3REE4_9STRA
MTRKKATKTVAMSAVAAMNGKRDDGNVDGGRREQLSRWHPIRVIPVVVSAGLVILFCASYFQSDLPSASTISGTPPDAVSNLSVTDIAASLSSGFDEFYAANVQPLLDMGARSLDGVAHAAEEDARVGHQLRRRDAHAKYPVLWEGRNCLKQHFRQRLWGSAAMAKAFLADSECWRRHLMLDPRSGLDPENIRAADNFVGSFWVWSKIIENLADVGYDGSTMTMLGFQHLEDRDGYFTKLRHAIEGHLATTGQKAVIVSHSMGGLVSYYFFQWIVSEVRVGGGGGGKDWVENHVHAFVNIAGPMLGVPKAIPALLSGELKDTAVMFPQLGDLLEKFFGRKWRRNLWTTWGSLFGMLPKGGDAIWDVGADLMGENDQMEGNDDTIAKDGALASSTTRPLLVPAIVWHNGTDEICPAASAPPGGGNEDPLSLHALKIHPSRTWSVSAVIEYLLKNDGGGSSSIYSFDGKKGWNTRSSSVDKRLHWHDPIATKLPSAPSLNIYCLYGVGIETERSYYYKVSCDENGDASRVDKGQACPQENEDETQRCGNVPNPNDDEPREAPFFIDTAAKDDSRNVRSGVRFSDGDVTVPLLSLGYMRQKWAEPGTNLHNPSGVGVYTRERRHEARVSLSDPGRAGPMAGEHVDILGNVGVIEDVVRIATGFEVEEKVNEDIIVSDLKRIVKTIDEHCLGGSSSVFQ